MPDYYLIFDQYININKIWNKSINVLKIYEFNYMNTI